MAVVASTRRSPRFGSFLVTGALLGFLLGSMVAVFGGQDDRYSAGSAVGYFGVLGAGVCALIAGVVAVLLDRRG